MDDQTYDGGLTRRQLLQGLGGALGAGALGDRLHAAARPQSSARGVETIRDVFPRTATLIEQAAARGGAGQFYLSLGGKILADIAWGQTPDGTPYTPSTLVSWASAVKPTTCTSLMKLWERGKLDLDKVTKFIPEFGPELLEPVGRALARSPALIEEMS